MQKIKPCSCGGRANTMFAIDPTIIVGPDDGTRARWHFVGCLRCNLHGKLFVNPAHGYNVDEPFIEKAIESWNNRFTQSSQT